MRIFLHKFPPSDLHFKGGVVLFTQKKKVLRTPLAFSRSVLDYNILNIPFSPMRSAPECTCLNIRIFSRKIFI